jgi:hypothetical protein
LTDIDEWVDGLASIMHDVDFLQSPPAGTGVDFNLGHRLAMA